VGVIVRYLIARFGEVVLEWTLAEILRRMSQDGGVVTDVVPEEDAWYWEEVEPDDWEELCR